MIKRALVAGFGSIGERHFRLLRDALPATDIRVLRRPESLPTAGVLYDLEDACNFAPEVAIISNPAPFHLETATALANAGTHLLVEKPISNDTNGVGDLISLCSDKNRILQVGYNLRFLEAVQRFRSKIKSGTIGDVQVVRCEIGQFLPDWRPGKDYRQSVSARSDLGGGALLELSHEIDLLNWIFGDIAWIRAWTGRLSQLEIDVEDCVMLQMGFSSGAVGQAGMDFLRRDATRSCIAIGSKGTLKWDAAAGCVSHYDAETGEWVNICTIKTDRDASYTAQIRALLQAVETSASSDIAANGQDGLAVMQVISAAHRSAAEGGREIAVKGNTL